MEEPIALTPPDALQLFIRRLHAEIRYSYQLGTEFKISARLFLNDFFRKGALFYSEKQLPHNQNVVFNIYTPKLHFFRGKILSSNEFNYHSRIIYANPMPYRTLILFDPQTEAEREALHKFQQTFVIPHTQQPLERPVVEPVKPARIEPGFESFNIPTLIAA